MRNLGKAPLFRRSWFWILATTSGLAVVGGAVALFAVGTSTATNTTSTSTTSLSTPSTTQRTRERAGQLAGAGGTGGLRDAELTSGGGWALTTAGLEVTANSGNSFSVVRPPLPVDEIHDVQMSGTKITVVGTTYVPDGRNTTHPSIFVTSSPNHGSTWSHVVSFPGPSNFPLDALRLVSAGGSVVGLAVTADEPPLSFGVWFSTPDNGRTWTQEAALPSSGGRVVEAGGVLWLVTQPTSQHVFKSSDNGATWTRVGLPRSITGEAVRIAGAFTTGRVVLVANEQSALMRVSVDVLTSSNAGKTWQALAETSLTGNLESGLTTSTSVADNDVWIGGSGPSLHMVSRTGRVTDISGPQGIGSVTTVTAASATRAWVRVVTNSCPSGKASCHDTRAMYRTTNGGANWVPIQFPYPTKPTSAGPIPATVKNLVPSHTAGCGNGAVSCPLEGIYPPSMAQYSTPHHPFLIGNVYFGTFGDKRVVIYAGGAVQNGTGAESTPTGGIRLRDGTAPVVQYLLTGSVGPLKIESVSGVIVHLEAANGGTASFDVATDSFTTTA